MPYLIKAALPDPEATTVTLRGLPTMYGGKSIAAGDRVYLFDSETQGGQGLVARGTVARASAVPRRPGVARQAPCVDVTVEVTERAKRRLGRSELRTFRLWSDGRPETELNFKFYRQATNKIGGISEAAAAFLDGCF